jgi:hypothetical protein
MLAEASDNTPFQTQGGGAIMTGEGASTSNAAETDLLRTQTARNLAGLEHEQHGQWDAAIALYEANVAEGFPGDWTYGHLAMIYGKRGQPEEVVRVLERAVEVFTALPREYPERGPRLRVFGARLAEAQQHLEATRQSRPPQPAPPPPAPPTAPPQSVSRGSGGAVAPFGPLAALVVSGGASILA